MKIITKVKNLELTPDLESFVEEKFNTLKKFINIDIGEISVEVEKETKHHRKGEIFDVKAIILLPGKKIMAAATLDDPLKSIIEARDQLKLEIEKYKFKIIDKNRRKQRKNEKDKI